MILYHNDANDFEASKPNRMVYKGQPERGPAPEEAAQKPKSREDMVGEHTRKTAELHRLFAAAEAQGVPKRAPTAPPRGESLTGRQTVKSGRFVEETKGVSRKMTDLEQDLFNFDTIEDEALAALGVDPDTARENAKKVIAQADKDAVRILGDPAMLRAFLDQFMAPGHNWRANNESFAKEFGEDGKPLKNVMTVIRRAQRKLGIDADGKLGNDTMAALHDHYMEAEA